MPDQAEHGSKIGCDDGLQFVAAIVFRFITVQLAHALGIQKIGAACKDCIKHAAFRLEIVVQESGIDVRKLGDLAHSHAINAVPGEQFLGGVQNAFAGGKTSLRAFRGLVVQKAFAQGPAALTYCTISVSPLQRGRRHTVNAHAPSAKEFYPRSVFILHHLLNHKSAQKAAFAAFKREV